MTPDPYRSHRLVAMVDADGHLTDDPSKAVRGEVEAVHHDGTTENILFVVPRRSTMFERWKVDEDQHAEHYRAEHARRPSGCLLGAVVRLLRRLLQAAR